MIWLYLLKVSFRSCHESRDTSDRSIRVHACASVFTSSLENESCIPGAVIRHEREEVEWARQANAHRRAEKELKFSCPVFTVLSFSSFSALRWAFACLAHSTSSLSCLITAPGMQLSFSRSTGMNSYAAIPCVTRFMARGKAHLQQVEPDRLLGCPVWLSCRRLGCLKWPSQVLSQVLPPNGPLIQKRQSAQ